MKENLATEVESGESQPSPPETEPEQEGVAPAVEAQQSEPDDECIAGPSGVTAVPKPRTKDPRSEKSPEPGKDEVIPGPSEASAAVPEESVKPSRSLGTQPSHEITPRPIATVSPFAQLPKNEEKSVNATTKAIPRRSSGVDRKRRMGDPDEGPGPPVAEKRAAKQ